MFARYVAIGDSTTEGLDDPDGAGGYRGWADRLAAHLATVAPLAYANLAVRGRATREIRAEQLDAALALAPDLATIVAGMNDLLRGGFDPVAIAADLGAMQRALIDAGVTVVTVTIPDIAPNLAPGPIGRRLSARTHALNAQIRAVTAATGARLFDLAAIPVATDPRLWSDDRLHANALGHARLAAALAQLLGVPGFDDSWGAPLPPPAPVPLRARVASHAAWARAHFAPWLWRRARGRTTGDDRQPKRPTLLPVSAVAAD